ncbi:DUF6247 family protein [Nocardiopsis halophila]|uniref:DUF6247 family protein n=1 Tax=Nocardiopsis halophila TaxID=141692 RepID=UPI0003727F34|nr:DUF6247 family protein [Nocardiopsis halophila]
MAMPSTPGSRDEPLPECTPAAVRAAIADLHDPALLRQYEQDLDCAYKQARSDSDLSILIKTVRRWWFEVDARRDPERFREYTQRVNRYLNDGPPPPEERISRAEILERFDY